jgi:glycosyl transferase family 25
MINKIYYVNLNRRVDRKEHVINEINKTGYNGSVERIEAVDGKQLNINTISNKLITPEGKEDVLNVNAGMYYILTPGAVGCALSHLNIYNKIIEEMSDNDYALILEDDVTIVDNFFNKLTNYIKNIPQFDILYIGYHYYTNDDPSRKIYDTYGEPTKIFGTFGYIINKKAANEIKKVFPLRYQIDTEIPKIFKNINVFYLKEKLVHSDESQNTNSKFKSDVQSRDLNENFKNISKKINLSNQFDKKSIKLFILLILVLAILIFY